MAKEIEELLEEEIRAQLEKLSSLNSGTPEHSAATADLERLYKLKIQEVENERAFRARCDRDVLDERELQLKAEQLDEQRKSRWWSNGIQIGTVAGGWAMYEIWQRRGYKFETVGTITTPWLRNLVSRMLPKR